MLCGEWFRGTGMEENHANSVQSYRRNEVVALDQISTLWFLGSSSYRWRYGEGLLKMRTSKKRIHINQHIIKSNQKTGNREPVITVKTYKSNDYYHTVHIEGPCKVIYSPDKPLSCGARVWIETEADVKGEKILYQSDSLVQTQHVKYTSYEEISDYMAEVICSHANVNKITDVSLEDINGYDQGMVP